MNWHYYKKARCEGVIISVMQYLARGVKLTWLAFATVFMSLNVFGQEGKQSSFVEIEVSVFDNKGAPVEGVAVSAVPELADDSRPATDIGTMDQINRQFAPHFLVVQRGTKVRFPNSDSIKHHVYSFSAAKRFELLLNKGMEEDPQLFDKAGIVELGCNVHDWMLGYIYVVDTPYFAHTDNNGIAQLALPSGNFRIDAWHPRMQEEPEVPSREVSVTSDKQVEFRLEEELLTDFEDYQSDDEFGDYE